MPDEREGILNYDATGHKDERRPDSTKNSLEILNVSGQFLLLVLYTNTQ